MNFTAQAGSCPKETFGKTEDTNHISFFQMPNAPSDDHSDTPFSATFHVSHFVLGLELTKFKNCHIIVCQNCVLATIDILNTLALVENQIKDFYEHAQTHHFSCHGRTNFQWYRNLADRHPSVPVNSTSHDSAATSTVVLGAAIPEAFHRLPCLCFQQ